MNLRDQIVLITGSSSGIGREAALRFAAKGAVPVLVARSQDKLTELAQEIQLRYNIEAPVYAMDVTDPDAVQTVTQAVLDRFGRVDILVNNSGFGVFKSTVEIPMEEVEAMMDVNYFGLVRMTKAILPSMLERNSGHIINTASLAGFFAGPTHGCYAATKFAVMGFSEALRFELHGTGVTLSTINPGPVETPFFDNADRNKVPKFAAFLQPEAVADSVLRAAVERKPLYLLPKIGGIGIKLRYLFPSLYDRVMTRVKH
ncbi:MAG TPA: SDR family oxidoreductase [Bacilli bacterium]|nr:SDR family oxidoreductase [Bacilli bacterium]